MMILVTHVSAMPLLRPQRRNAAPVPPDRPDVSGGRTGAAEDRRQPGSPGRTDRLRHSGEDLRCPLPIRGEAGAFVQSRRTDGNLGAFVRPRPGLCRFVGEAGLPEAITASTRRATATYDPPPVIFRMVLGQLLDPQSKLSTHRWAQTIR